MRASGEWCCWASSPLLITHAPSLKSQGSSIGGYQLVSQQPQKNGSLFTYRATLTNNGGPLARASATAIVSGGSLKLVDNALSFGRVTGGAAVGSTDTFSLTYNKDNPDLSRLVWTITPTPNQAPVANAGPDFSRPIGQIAQLDGRSSSDPDGDGITYAWSFTSRPAGSVAALSNATSPTPTFLVDRPGPYVLQLVVSDGFASSAPDSITVLGPNTVPIANAGPDQTLPVGSLVTLDASGSFDADGHALTYAWSITTAPGGSHATLSNPTTVHPSFTIDAAGPYVVRLVVNDGIASSTADTVAITTLNSSPVANAGPDQTAVVTQTVTLDGTGSSDVDGDPLTFAWTLTNRPAGSGAVLLNANAVHPTFTIDRPGTFVAALTVNDGRVTSAPDTVIINTRNSAPVANAGSDQTAFVTAIVTLNGSGSTDVDGDVITHAWSLISVPAGSSAALSDPTAVTPTLVIDRPGLYIAQLIVNDGTTMSVPDTVSITTQNSAPVANAGIDQTVFAGQTVLVDGLQSSDVDGDPLTFRWSFTSLPLNSAASLANAGSRVASFVADRPGNYVVQLIVNDGSADSAPDTVAVTTTNSMPVAVAGPDQSNLRVGQVVALDGTQSSDADGQPLTYLWSLIARPASSLAGLTGPTTSTPTLTPDAAGDYVAQLIVSDGFTDSQPDTVLIQVAAPLHVADAGPDQQVLAGAIAQLDGSGSSGTLLSYFWEFTSRPAGSSAVLQNPATINPSFVADLAGDFIVRLAVTDGVGAVATDDVVVTASSPQTLPLVTLNPLDLTVAAGQAATFTAAATGNPSPTVQWQRSTDGGATYTDFPGATSETLTFITVPADHGNQFRAVFSNAVGVSMTAAATLSVTVTTVTEPITVTDSIMINGAPMLAPLVDQTVSAGTPATFTAVVIDPATPTSSVC